MEAQDYKKLIEALRRCAEPGTIIDECDTTDDCPYSIDGYCGDCMNNLVKDAAAAIEALQKEVQFYKALAEEWKSSAENKERLLRLYRAEQAKHFYSAMDNNGRIIANPCACMNIPVFPDSSESPNS